MRGDDGEEIKYYNCPLQFVPFSVDAFMQKKALIDSGFVSKPPLADLSAWDAEAFFYYRRWFNFCAEVKNRSDYGDLG